MKESYRVREKKKERKCINVERKEGKGKGRRGVKEEAETTLKESGMEEGKRREGRVVRDSYSHRERRDRNQRNE